MSSVLLVLACIVAYMSGLIIIMRMTPLLLARAFDEGLFMVIAAADILGGLLAFGGVIVPLLMFNAPTSVRILDFFLLVGILLVALREALRSLRLEDTGGTFRVSRIIAGTYGLFLAAAAVFYIIQLFLPLTS